MSKDPIQRSTLPPLDLTAVPEDERIGPITPGEILHEEFMLPLKLSARALARELGVPPDRITEIVNGERAISAQTAILLSKRFGTSAEFWMNLQVAHDLEMARAAMGHVA